jgi:hypothetical protein
MYNHPKRTRLEGDVVLKLSDSAPRRMLQERQPQATHVSPRGQPETVTCRWLSGYLKWIQKECAPPNPCTPPCTARVAFLKHGCTLKAVILDLDSLLDA